MMIGHSYPRLPRGISGRRLGAVLSYAKSSHLQSSNHRIGAHADANQTVPYGTALMVGAVPGTSCQAAIAPSLRDKRNRPVRERRSEPAKSRVSLPRASNIVFVPSIVLVLELELLLDFCRWPRGEILRDSSIH
jgi:hypothetical protein